MSDISNNYKLKQYFITYFIIGYLPNFKILRKENFYTKQIVKILRIALFGKVWFYHLTFKRFL